jgi:PAS domain S-box-containing protein/putative nucleotidyltransferase with HDIG domain
MQATLREREAMFRLLAENSTDMIVRHDGEGKCLYISPASHALLGYEPDELVGHSSFEFIHPEDLPEPINALNLLHSQDTVTNVSYRVQRKDGSLAWFETSFRALRDPQTSAISEIHAASRDITARRKAEDELRANEDRFRSLVQNSYEIIIVLSAEGKIIYESPSTTRILGYLPGRLLGQTPDFLVHPDDLPRVEIAINGLLQKYQYANTIEFRVRHANNSWIFLEAFGTNLIDHPGVNGIVVTLRDISERKRSEVALQSAHIDLVQAYEATIEGWSRALDLRDHETEGHTQRVAEMTVKLASAVGIPDPDWIHIRRGALLHDIGKMCIPDAILQKPGVLTDAEWVIMQTHPEKAYQLLSTIDYLAPAIDIPYCHHEKWDGSGYPRGLKGEEIPLVARIFAVVDVYDAITSDRPYGKAWSKERALAHIQEQSGKHFYPAAVEAFLEILEG